MKLFAPEPGDICGINRDRFITFCSNVQIQAKDADDDLGEGAILVPADLIPTQVYLLDQFLEGLKNGIHFFVVLKCLAPETLVITSDLRWVRLGDVEIRDELLAFDEHSVEGSHRGLRPAQVLNKWTSRQMAWKVTFDDGRSLTCSAHHQFLVQKRGGVDHRWSSLMRLKVGDRVRNVVNPWTEPGYEDGWVGGFIDGEGTLHYRDKQGTRVGVYQRDNEALDRYKTYLESLGYGYSENIDTREGEIGSKLGDQPIHHIAVNNLEGCLRLIGQTRPSRFINQRWWEGKRLGRGGHAVITKIETVLEQELIDIETSTGTFIAEGKCTHNCRQSGTTTLGLLFELWWAYTHKGFITNFIADNAQRLAVNRALIENMVATIREDWAFPIRESNKNLMRFENSSMMIWNNANARDEGGYGRGVGAHGFHATEIGRYRDEEGWMAMLDGIAHKHKSRFYLAEGTSEGPNMFKDVWDEASRPNNVTQKAIFIGWWLHPHYDADVSDPIGKKIYDVYWGGMPRLDRRESDWVRGVKERYNYEIRDTQIAWWRYMIAERKQKSYERMCQEYPPLPELAWMFGGKGYVNGAAVALQVNRAKINAPQNRYFQLEYGNTFHDTKIVEVQDGDWYDLVTFVEPQKGPLVRYVIGVDPAHGASEESDACAIEVFQCYSDCMVQVAEYNGTEEPSYHLAWVLLHLAGAYNGQTMVNIELQGGGYAIQDEIRRLQESMASGYDNELSQYFSDLRFYIFHQGDAIYRSGHTFNWITSEATKERMLTVWKELFEQGKAHVHSPELIAQTNKVHRLKDGSIQMPKDDHRIMAAAIGAMAYCQVIDNDIGNQKIFEKFEVDAVTLIGDPSKQKQYSSQEIMQNRLLTWKSNLEAQMRQERAEQIENEPEWRVQMRESLMRNGEL